MDKKKLSRYIISSTMVVNALAAPVAVFANDVTDASVNQEAIRALVEKGVFTGDDKGNLNMEGQLTRIQFATIIAKALKLDVDSIAPSTSNYSDVSADSWGLKYIAALEKLGIMVGYVGKFRPNDKVTLEELAVILVRVTQTNVVGKGNNIPASDANKISDWAKPFVQAALENKLIPLTNGAFDAQRPITREQVALVTNNFISTPAFEAFQESIKTLLDEGKKVSNSDPTI